MVKLSVVVITFNEARNIARCLESVKNLADDILVVDSFSTDHTEEICKQYPVRFIKHAFEGHIQQKNFAISQARYEHVLSLDADEAVSETLERSILQAKKNFVSAGYTMNRLTNYCGSWIYHCGWYPDRKLRLFDRTKGAFEGVNPHDEFRFASRELSPVQLQGDLLHYSYYSLDDHYKQVEKFTTIAAKAYYEKGKKVNFLNLRINPITKFLRDYILLGGFLDGKAGFRICWISAGATYKKYAKLKALYKHP